MSEITKQGTDFLKTFLFLGVILGVALIVMNTFFTVGDSQAPLTGSAYHSNGTTVNGSTIVGQVNGSILNFVTQMPTIGTIMGVALLVIIVFASIIGLIMKKKNDEGGF